MRNVAIETPQLAREAAARTVAERRKAWLFAGLCAVVALAPLPLGSARPLAWDIIGLAVALLLAASLVLPAAELRLALRELRVPLALFALVVLFVLLQASPWVPASWRNPVWDQAADTLGHPVTGSIAIDRQAALIGLFRLLTYAGIFWLTYLLCRERSRAHQGLRLATIAGGVYAIYGLAIYWSGNHSILWLAKWAYTGDLTGTFVNRNSFACYLGLTMVAALAQAFVIFKGLEVSRGSRREKLAKTIEFASAHIWVVVLVFLVFTALVLTHSRGGLLSSIVGIAALVLALAMAPSVRRAPRLGILLLLAAMAAAAFLISGEATVGRLVAESGDISGRTDIYAATLRAFADHPFLGWGLGSFTSVFPIYRTTDVLRGFVNAAHDSYLETILELGLPAALALFLALAWPVGFALRGIRTRRRDAAFPCLAAAATALVACHSTVDFSLQIPAVTVLYLFLLGMGATQSWSSRGGDFNDAG